MSLESGFRIGEIEVHPQSGVIRGPRGETRVEPKSMAVLVELARHAPEIRSRDQIVAAVWPRGFVTDDVLTRCIGQLRRALEDDPRTPGFLQTTPKRGYCLRHEVQPLQRTAPRSLIATSGVPSLIVLPFQNLSAQLEDYIADGVTELLISRLALLTRLRVISRTTAMQFKGRQAGIAEIAARTGADWVVEGSVLQSGDRLQVVAQLIEARNDEHVWAADYVRSYGDLLELQNEIASRVATAIRLQLGATQVSPPAAPSLPAQTMRDYLKARHMIGRRTVPALESARSLLDAVTGAAPDYASG